MSIELMILNPIVPNYPMFQITWSYLIPFVISRHCSINLLYFTLQSGQTPLHIAVTHGHSTIIEALILSGAKVDIRDKVSIYHK